MESLACGSRIGALASSSAASCSETGLVGGKLGRGDDRVGLRRRERGRGVRAASSSVSTSPSSAEEKAPAKGTTLGPYTGRDPSVKKPAWLRQRAPQGEKLEKLKESIGSLKLNTVCEEAQCPNIGEVVPSAPVFSCLGGGVKSRCVQCPSARAFV
jgi:hypothetical protein